MEVIREIRELNSESITINVPEQFRKRKVEILVVVLDQVSNDITSGEESEEEPLSASGLCGIWEDDRTSDEIVDDIYSHRTGFGNREIEL